MHDTNAQLLISALAMIRPDLIDHMRVTAAPQPVAEQVKEQLGGYDDQRCEDLRSHEGLHDVFSSEWPQLCVMFPLHAGVSPIAHWEVAFGPGSPDELN